MAAIAKFSFDLAFSPQVWDQARFPCLKIGAAGENRKLAPAVRSKNTFRNNNRAKRRKVLAPISSLCRQGGKISDRVKRDRIAEASVVHSERTRYPK